jgi:predicted GNAT superfamily acetyltransferase
VAGSRFKYTPEVIDFNYNSLVGAICEAIDKQAEEDGAQYFTAERSNVYVSSIQELNFDDLMTEFHTIVTTISESTDDETFATYWQPRITQTIEKYLGRGVKVSQCSREQTEALDLIVTEMREFLVN